MAVYRLHETSFVGSFCVCPFFASDRRQLSCSRPNVRVVQASAKIPDDTSEWDYFPLVKAENTSDKIEIYGKDDYEHTAGPLPWDVPYRGRSIEEIKARNKSKKVPESLPGHVFRWTDLFTEKERDADERLVKEAYLGDHKVYDVPVTKKNDLKNYDGIWLSDTGNPIDMDEAGKMLSQLGARRAPEGEVVTDEMLEGLLWEIGEADLQPEDEMVGYAEELEPPDHETFKKWRRESEKRGGSALKGGTDMLSPVKDLATDKSTRPIVEGAKVPLQNTSLCAHGGVWDGVATIYRLDKAGRFSLEQRLNCIRDKITLEEPYDHDVLDPITHRVSRTVRNCEEALSPGKAVWESGSYAFFGDEPLIISNDLKRYIGGHNLEILGEMCVVPSTFRETDTDPSGSSLRFQAIICGEKVTVKKRRGIKVTKVIVVREKRRSAVTFQGALRKGTAPALDLLSGIWRGAGLSLHPMNYLHPAELTSSLFRLERMSVPPPHSSGFTYHLKQAQSPEDEVRVEAKRAYQQHKSSTRMKSARSFDERQIAQCKYVEDQTLGCFKERNAVKIHEAQGAQALEVQSLRLGEFIDDKRLIVEEGGVAVGFPSILDEQRVELVQLIVPDVANKRIRLVVSLAVDGTMSGAVLLTEVRQAACP